MTDIHFILRYLTLYKSHWTHYDCVLVLWKVLCVFRCFLVFDGIRCRCRVLRSVITLITLRCWVELSWLSVVYDRILVCWSARNHIDWTHFRLRRAIVLCCKQIIIYTTLDYTCTKSLYSRLGSALDDGEGCDDTWLFLAVRPCHHHELVQCDSVVY